MVILLAQSCFVGYPGTRDRGLLICGGLATCPIYLTRVTRFFANTVS